MGRFKGPSGEAGKPQPKTDDEWKAAAPFDKEIDEKHSVDDEFGFPLWAKAEDESKKGNTAGAVEETDTDDDDDTDETDA